MTFTYQGPNFRLISQQRVEKVLPPSNLLDTKKGKSGFWFEFTDSEQNILYQKSIINLIQTDTEIFSNELKESIMRQKGPQIEGTFSILIPDLPEAKTFSLFGNPIQKNHLSNKTPITLFEMDLDKVEE